MTKDTEEEQIMKEFQRRRRKQHQTGWVLFQTVFFMLNDGLSEGGNKKWAPRLISCFRWPGSGGLPRCWFCRQSCRCPCCVVGCPINIWTYLSLIEIFVKSTDAEKALLMPWMNHWRRRNGTMLSSITRPLSPPKY
jgi:hypothetical protein